jgi:hypothetical protein
MIVTPFEILSLRSLLSKLSAKKSGLSSQKGSFCFSKGSLEGVTTISFC